GGMLTMQKSGSEVVALLERADASVAAALAEVNFQQFTGDEALAVMAAVEKLGRRADGARVASATEWRRGRIRRGS
ncbi:hypothetical protein, partial [Cryobacterium roopkundense]|uniref:hypothetical protein n=1 Tax=Cryobacterium roopkundense TaxID=1001240 RepID=UPI000566A228